jgi:hypothetical protein
VRTSDSPSDAMTKTFDYGAVGTDIAQKLQGIVNTLKNRFQRSSDEVIGTGRLLLEAKKVLGHGRYLKWLDDEIGLPRSTAARLTRTASLFRGVTPNALGRIEVTAMYLLSCDRCPQHLREWILEQAEDGDNFTARAIRELMTERPPKTEDKPDEKSAKLSSTVRRGPSPEALQTERESRAWRSMRSVLDAGGSIFLDCVADEEHGPVLFRANVYQVGQKTPSLFARCDLESLALAITDSELKRTCIGCGIEKPEANFQLHASSGKPITRCKECEKARLRISCRARRAKRRTPRSEVSKPSRPALFEEPSVQTAA